MAGGYETTISDYDGYGNPQLTVLGGSTVADTIDTITTYHIDEDLWIVNQAKNQNIVGVGDTVREFDASGNLESINQYGTTTTFTYTSEGDLATEKNAKDQTTKYFDYYRGTPRRIEYPENKTIIREVNNSGTVKSETNGRGFKTSYEYDVMNRIKLVDLPINTDVTIGYTSNNSRLVRTLTRGDFQEITTFNGLLNPVQIEKLDTVTNQRITTVTEYDIYDRPTFISKPTYGSYSGILSQTDGISRSYDALGREVLVRNPDGTQRRFCYIQQDCGSGPIATAGTIEVQDERGFNTVSHYYAYGTPDNNLLRNLDAPENVRTIINYDKLGNVTRIWQGENGGLGHEHLYHYDSHFFRIAEDQPEVGHIVLGRDAIGNLTSRQIKNSLISGSTLPDSGETTFIYDDRNRLKTIDYPSTTPDVSFEYDENDNIKSVSNQNSSRIYDYDANDNLLSEDITIEEESYSLIYGYNSLDQLDSITYPSNRAVSYGNDAFGRPTDVSAYIDQVSYYPGGQIESINYSNGVSTSFELTEREWIESIQVDGATNSDIVSLGYDYDGKGNVKTITDNAGINSRSMTYDGVDRLMTADGMWGTGSYTYDQEDNMKTRNINGVAEEYVEINNKMRQLLRDGNSILAPPFDVYGNQTSSLQHDLTFDDASNLIEAELRTTIITNIPPIIFKYDGDKHRVYRDNSEGTTHYVYTKGGSVLAEVNVDTDTSKENIYLGSQIVASIKGNDDPVAKIVAVGNVQEKTMLTLDGTTSFDPDGDIASYQWVQKSGVDVALDGLGPGMVEFESPLVSKDETLVFELVVTDNKGDTNSAQISVVVELTDTDTDGLSDLWESIFFPSNLGALESTGDYDNDGITDLDEFLNNSDPTVFNDLDTPNGIQVSAGVSDLTLSWAPIDRANRYAIYWSTDKTVALTDTNRFYASSSPFVHDSLPSGQYFYYVVVAERIDGNGAFIGGSSASSVVNGKVGWKIWPQNVLQSTVFGNSTSLRINTQGEVRASWINSPSQLPGGGLGGPGGDPTQGEKSVASYNQQSGWSPASTTDDLPPIAVSNVRLVDEVDGIHAEYYTEGSGWGNRELIFADSSDTWEIKYSRFNVKGEGLVVLHKEFNIDDPQSLYYSPDSGWGSPQFLQILPAGETRVTSEDLYFSDAGLGHLLFDDVNGLSVISFTETLGWHDKTSLGLQGNIVSAGSAAGFVHAVGVHEDAGSPGMSIVSSVNFSPTLGWSSVIPTITTPFSHDNAIGHSFGSVISVDVNNMGQAVLVIRRARAEQFYVVKEYLPATGWQNEVIRAIPAGCEYDDIPDTRERDFFPDSAVFNNIGVSLDVKISERGDWSVLSNISSTSPRSVMLVASRREADASWLEDEILHCPAMIYGFGFNSITSMSQAVNNYGTTFVLWSYADSGEATGDTKVLTNQYELLRGVAPVANAGADQSVTEGDSVTLDATLSIDADNFIESYRWTQQSGIAVNIADGDQEVATFFAPLVDSDETLVFELQIIDSVGNVAIDTVEIVVGNLSSTEPGVVLVTDKISPLVQGDQLTLTAQGQGGSGGAHEFKFRIRPIGGDTSQPWETLQDFASSNSLIWDTTNYAGKYKVQVVAREIGNEAVEVKDNLTYWVNSANPVTHVDLTNNSANIVTEGSSVILEALAQGGTGTTDYQYQVKNNALQADWITLRDFSQLENLVWDTSGYRGENIIRVRARNTGTNDLWVKDKLKVWVNSADAVTSVSLLPNLLSPQLSGTAVSMDTSIIGGNSAVEYQFSVKDTEGLDEWVVAQSWSTATSFNWDTTGLYGKFRVRVESRNVSSGDKAIVDKISYWLNSDNPLSEVTLQMDQTSPIVVGPVVNLTAMPVDGSGSFEYQFRVKGSDQGDNWSILRDFDSNPNLQVSTSSFIGRNIFQVRARNTGTLDKYAKARSVLWVNQLNPVTSAGLTASDTDVIWGDSITFDLSIIGGDGSFYLTKELKRPGEGKYEGDGFFRETSDTQFTFDVGGIQPGTYRMRVRVMNAATDKPVKSVSVKFKVSENPAPEWQVGGANHGNINSCSIYECPCTVFNVCNVEPDGVTIIGY